MSAASTEHHSADSSAAAPFVLPLQVVWALLVAGLGGYLCALVVDKFGEVGSISLWGLGALAGMVSWRISRRSSKPIAWALVVATIVAFLVAETLWIYWHPKLTYVNAEQQTESIWLAFLWLPTFFQKYSTAAFVGGIMTGFGAYSAYRQNA